MQTFIHAWLGLVIDVSLKSLALAAVAGVALLALRARDTNLRHRVWTAVLLGMLAMPALVRLTPAIPLPGWITVAIPADSKAPIADGVRLETAADKPAAPREVRRAINMDDSTSSEVADSPARIPPLDRPNDPRLSVQRSKSQNASIPIGKPAPERASVTVMTADRLVFIAASVYAAVAAIFVVRLLVGLLLARRLIAQARGISWTGHTLLPRRRRVRLLESALIAVPATVGFIRPVVLLPACWRQWSEPKLQAVLAHELAHVRRADWLVITLAELNRAVYWFHPLAWFLRRRLAELAESNCDDAVLEADGDRAQYARHLLEVAGLLTTDERRYRAPVQGVAMARKPNVETRIEAILDAGRPLAHRLGAPCGLRRQTPRKSQQPR